MDGLIDTVLQQRHIPPIVLVADDGDLHIDSTSINLRKFKILDGLQRTFRLKLIWDTIQLFENEVDISEDILSMKRLQLSRKYSAQLNSINSSAKILESVIRFYQQGNKKPSEKFKKIQWFEIWSGLSPRDEVNKMLILNAGHKPVKTQHQLEILFLNLIPIFEKAGLNRFQLIREKEANSTFFNKSRELGQFHFSHLITAILSLKEGKPVTANINLIHKAQSEEFNIDDFAEIFNYEFLEQLIRNLLLFDDNLKKHFGPLGTRWLGREISLVGIFAALGKFKEIKTITYLDVLEIFKNVIIEHVEYLNLKEFEKIRNSLDIGKINIGTANKNAVYNGIFTLLDDSSKSINWTNFFAGQ